MKLNKDIIISINKEIGEKGYLRNESSLEYAIQAITDKLWLYQLAYLLRCLLVDHCFEDGNKRTAMAIAMLYFDQIEYDRERLIKTIYDIARKNIIDVNKIMRLIKDVIY